MLTYSFYVTATIFFDFLVLTYVFYVSTRNYKKAFFFVPVTYTIKLTQLIYKEVEGELVKNLNPKHRKIPIWAGSALWGVFVFWNHSPFKFLCRRFSNPPVHHFGHHSPPANQNGVIFGAITTLATLLIFMPFTCHRILARKTQIPYLTSLLPLAKHSVLD